MEKKSLAVFDIDGTLTRSVGIHQAAYLQALGQCGYTNVDTNWNNYPHHTDSAIFGKIYELQRGARLHLDEVLRFEAALQDCMCSMATEQAITEIEGASAFLEYLQHRSSFQVVYATGSLLKPAYYKLAEAGFDVPPELVIASNELQSREEVVDKAIDTASRYYGIPKFERIVSFGDGMWDWKTAQNLGLEFIGIGNSQLKEAGVALFFEHFNHQGLYTLMN